MNTQPIPSPLDLEPEPGSIQVEISDTQSHLRIDSEVIVALVRATLRAEQVEHASISIALVDDPTIRVVNRRHLDHDWPTDVISFVLSDPSDDELAGELIVSAETTVASAEKIGVEPQDELALYLVHGLLHLCGHDDIDDADRDAMRRREGEILALLGRESARWTA